MRLLLLRNKKWNHWLKEEKQMLKTETSSILHLPLVFSSTEHSNELHNMSAQMLCNFRQFKKYLIIQK